MLQSLRRLFSSSRHVTRKPRRTVLCLELLEEREVPNATTWLGTAGDGGLASNAANWLNGVKPAADGSTDVTFDGTNNNKPIIWDNSNVSKCNSITLTSYTAQMTINANVKVYAVNGVTEDANSEWDIDFGDTSSKLEIDGTSDLAKFDFTDKEGSVYIDLGAFVSFEDTTQSTTADIHVYDTTSLGTELTLVALSGNNSRTFASGARLINHTGAYLYLDGTANNSTIATTGNSGGYLENWGTVIFDGRTGCTTDLEMPILNHGQFNVEGDATGDNNGGTLSVSNTVAATNGYNFRMETTGAGLNLSGGATLILEDATKSYLQSAGTLATTDGLKATLQLGILLNGFGKFTGGNVTLGGNSFGELDVWCNKVDFSGGEYDPKVDVSQSLKCDIFKVTGTFYIDPNNNTSTIAVTRQGNAGIGAKTCSVINATTWTANTDFNTKRLTDGITGRPVGGRYYELDWG